MQKYRQLYSERCYLPKLYFRFRVGSAIVGHLYSQVPMLKLPKSVNSKKTGGSDLDHPKAVSSSDKAILYACLYVCMCVRVRVGACVRACLSVTQGLDTLFFK